MSDSLPEPVRFYRSRTVLIGLAAYVVYAIVSVFVPLLSTFGFEFHLLLTVVTALVAAMTTVEFVFRLAPPDEPEVRTGKILAVGVFDLATRLVLIQFALLAVPVAIHALTSLVAKSTCNWSSGLAWFILLAPITAVYVTLWSWSPPCF